MGFDRGVWVLGWGSLRKRGKEGKGANDIFDFRWFLVDFGDLFLFLFFFSTFYSNFFVSCNPCEILSLMIFLKWRAARVI